MILTDHRADVDIIRAFPAWTVAPEVQEGLTRGLVLEDGGAGFGGRAIDDASEVFRRLPTDIVALVLPVRNPQVIQNRIRPVGGSRSTASARRLSRMSQAH